MFSSLSSPNGPSTRCASGRKLAKDGVAKQPLAGQRPQRLSAVTPRAVLCPHPDAVKRRQEMEQMCVNNALLFPNNLHTRRHLTGCLLRAQASTT